MTPTPRPLSLDEALAAHRSEPPRQPLPDLCATFQAADDAWANELRVTFGRHAGDVRYTPAGRGAPGTELRRLYDARTEAAEAYLADCRRARIMAPNCER